ncbi:MAG: bifunctional nuclease family protein [Anaerolineales bacterium]|nr:MAG: bifunctional nuclease family protein [Anaerolineales bacterium]
MIEVTLETIQMSLVSANRIVVLKEVEAERYLPIWIGPCEAESISVCVNGIKTPRPLTHDLAIQIIDVLGAVLSYIYINDLIDTTFHARVVLNLNGEELEVDSRSSDAIALAVRVDAPIFVAEHVMDAAGVVPEHDIDLDKQMPGETLEVFRDFLESLDDNDETLNS